MGDSRLNPGMGENSPDRKRAATTERFLGQFKKTTIIAKDERGEDRQYDVLATVPIPSRLAAASCAFGSIIDIPDSNPKAKGISGGPIHCGDQNWEMSPQELNLSVSGVWLVYIEVECTANTDDDGEIFLPGINTGTRPTGDWGQDAWTDPTDYPANTSPTLPSGDGTIILPIGKLTIAAGKAKLEATGCGGFTIGHCAGTLSYSRA